MYNLEDIFQEASADPYALNLDNESVEARLVFGVKIIKVKYNGMIVIQNTLYGGGYYKELSEDELKPFLEKGWRYGVYTVSLANYMANLDSLDKNIHELIISKASKGSIKEAQDVRTRIMKRYTKISKKLNLLK